MPSRFVSLICLVSLVWISLPSRAAWAADPAASATLPIPAKPAEWGERVQPFRIVGDVYYVGTKGLSAYLIRSKSGAILLDGTMTENVGIIEDNIQKLGVPLHDVRVSDHAHYDHVGALAKIKADTGARFVASAGDRWALEHGQARGDTTYAPIGFPPIAVDEVIADGGTVRLGGVRLAAHLTPGHTPGCTSWTLTTEEGGQPVNVLFLCSITVAGNVLKGNRAYPTIVADYRRTFETLRTWKADVVLTSHPEMADVLGREARREAGDAHAFIDPTALPAIVDAASAAFEHTLEQAPDSR